MPRGTMSLWAQVPGQFRAIGSLGFSKLLLREARVAVSPGVGFGEQGEGYVRFALIENRQRINQAVRNIRRALRLDRAATESLIPMSNTMFDSGEVDSTANFEG